MSALMTTRSSADVLERVDWKRKYWREVHVNQELGRRLRDLKAQLAQQQHCAKCQTLEDELMRLRAQLNPNQQEPKDPEPQVPEDPEAPEPAMTEEPEPVQMSRPQPHRLRRSNSILIRAQSGRIHCLRDILDNLTPSASVPAPETQSTTSANQQESHFSDTMEHFVNAAAEIKEPSISEASVSTELFKYALVIGAPRSKAVKAQQLIGPGPSLAQRLKNADYRRTRSLPEGTERQTETSAPLDLVPTQAANHRTGWLGNWVPQRFKAAGTPVVSNNQSVATATAPITTTPSAKTLFVYPQEASAAYHRDLEGLADLCFPYGPEPPAPTTEYSTVMLKRVLAERHRVYREQDTTFVLTLSAPEASKHQVLYGICLLCSLLPSNGTTTDDESEHGCLCLVSAYPFFGLFFKVLVAIASMWDAKRKDHLRTQQPLTLLDLTHLFELVMTRLHSTSVPSMGSWKRIVLTSDLSSSFHHALSFHRPHSESQAAERRRMVLSCAAPVLFGLLSIDQVLFLLGCLCCERKVLLVSAHVSIVSSCVLALTTLLDPLQWAGPVITVLPPRMDELLEAPVPLIAGRVATIVGPGPVNSDMSLLSTLTKPMKGVIEMNLDQNNLCMHEEDLVNYHELKLPGCDALVHELKSLSSILFEKMDQSDSLEIPTTQQMEACDVICARIRQHMDALCAVATGESTTLDLMYVSAHGGCTSPRNADGKPLPYFAKPISARRCSELVADYIERFQMTQMFTMYAAQHQETKPVDPEEEEEDEEDEEAYQIATTCDPDQLFTDDTVITYEPDLLQ